MTPEELADLAHLRRARDLIDRDYAKPLVVPAMARAALMSPAHFSRKFRTAYGETPYSYLMTRRIERAKALLRRATKESAVALNLALLVNSAILVTAAATFHDRGTVVDSLGQAHAALEPLLGPAAAIAFAIALLAAGLASCVTGSMASQLVIDGLVRTRRQLPLLVRRLVALVPAALIRSICTPPPPP